MQKKSNKFLHIVAYGLTVIMFLSGCSQNDEQIIVAKPLDSNAISAYFNMSGNQAVYAGEVLNYPLTGTIWNKELPTIIKNHEDWTLYDTILASPYETKDDEAQIDKISENRLKSGNSVYTADTLEIKLSDNYKCELYQADNEGKRVIWNVYDNLQNAFVMIKDYDNEEECDNALNEFSNKFYWSTSSDTGYGNVISGVIEDIPVFAFADFKSQYHRLVTITMPTFYNDGGENLAASFFNSYFTANKMANAFEYNMIPNFTNIDRQDFVLMNNTDYEIIYENREVEIKINCQDFDDSNYIVEALNEYFKISDDSAEYKIYKVSGISNDGKDRIIMTDDNWNIILTNKLSNETLSQNKYESIFKLVMNS